AAAPEPAVGDLTAERRMAPRGRIPRRHDVEVTVEVEGRPGEAALEPAEDVQPRRTVRRPPRRDVPDRVAERRQATADGAGALLVPLTGWVHGRDPHELAHEGGALVAQRVDRLADPVRVAHSG